MPKYRLSLARTFPNEERIVGSVLTQAKENPNYVAYFTHVIVLIFVDIVSPCYGFFQCLYLILNQHTFSFRNSL